MFYRVGGRCRNKSKRWPPSAGGGGAPHRWCEQYAAPVEVGPALVTIKQPELWAQRHALAQAVGQARQR